MPMAGFKHKITESKRPQTHALVRMATGDQPVIDIALLNSFNNYFPNESRCKFWYLCIMCVGVNQNV